MNTDPHADGAALSPAVLTTDEAESERRHRRFLGRRDLDQDPNVRFTVESGKRVAHVALSGRHGVGKEMRLDAKDWHWVAEEFGRGWGLMPNKGGTVSICSARVSLTPFTEQRGKSPRATLARLLLGAGKDEVVNYVDGDRLNLRKSNLRLTPRREHLARLSVSSTAH